MGDGLIMSNQDERDMTRYWAGPKPISNDIKYCDGVQAGLRQKTIYRSIHHTPEKHPIKTQSIRVRKP